MTAAPSSGPDTGWLAELGKRIGADGKTAYVANANALWGLDKEKLLELEAAMRERTAG